MPTLSTIILSIKGEARKANIQYNELTLDVIQKYFKKKEEPELICCYEDDKMIFIFGYKKGKKELKIKQNYLIHMDLLYYTETRL